MAQTPVPPINRRFLKALARELEQLKPGLAPTVIAATEAAYPVLYEQNLHQISDKPTKLYTTSGALFIAAYRALRGAGLGQQEAVGAIARSFRNNPPAGLMRFGMKLALGVPGNRFKRMSAMLRMQAASESMFGPQFTIENRNDGQTHEFVVHRCFCHKLCGENGAPEVTAVFCDWDHNWMDAVSPADHGISLTRPQTIAGGAPCCIFRVERTQK